MVTKYTSVLKEAEEEKELYKKEAWRPLLKAVKELDKIFKTPVAIAFYKGSPGVTSAKGGQVDIYVVYKEKINYKTPHLMNNAILISYTKNSYDITHKNIDTKKILENPSFAEGIKSLSDIAEKKEKDISKNAEFIRNYGTQLGIIAEEFGSLESTLPFYVK
jgi:hypothetical protein